jgi:hypothetical protein
MAAAAAIGFVTAASTSIAIVFAPLLAIRLFALRRPRDHAVTAGWLVGCLVQVPFLIQFAVSGGHRIPGNETLPYKQNNRLGNSLAFYFHDVILRSVGWHPSWWIESRTSQAQATLIVAVALAAVLGVIMARQHQARPFIIAALVTGFGYTIFAVILDPWAAVTATVDNEIAARYTALPTFLIVAALIAGTDCALRSRRDSYPRSPTGDGTRRRGVARSSRSRRWPLSSPSAG